MNHIIMSLCYDEQDYFFCQYAADFAQAFKDSLFRGERQITQPELSTHWQKQKVYSEYKTILQDKWPSLLLIYCKCTAA